MKRNFLQRAICCVLCLTLLFTAVPVQAASTTIIDSGTCDNGTSDVRWTLYRNGTLHISGTGDMGLYASANDSPWAAYRSQIVRIQIDKGVTSIGNFAFFQCTNLTSISLPNSLTQIRHSAFSGCSGLTSIHLPEGLTKIETNAFRDCSSLRAIAFPDTLTSLGGYVFQNCSSLQEIKFGQGLSSTGGWEVFRGCSSLRSLVIPATLKDIGLGCFQDCTRLTDVYFEGNAPTIFYSKEPKYPSAFDASRVTFYYRTGTTGWTDSYRYDWTSGTWQGHALKTWGTVYQTITPLQEDVITLNHSGYAQAYFRLTDAAGDPVRGAEVHYVLDGAPREAVTDGDGIFSVSPLKSQKVYTFNFSVVGFHDTLIGAQQKIGVLIDSFSYSQTWNGAIGGSAAVLVGPGVSAELGPASFEASLLNAGIGASLSNQLSVTHSIADSVRTLQLSCKTTTGAFAELKSGIELTLPGGTLNDSENQNKIGLFSLSGKTTLSAQSAQQLKLENYSPSNRTQLLQAARFLLMSALLNSNSATMKAVRSFLSEDPSTYSFSGCTDISLGMGASISGSGSIFPMVAVANPEFFTFTSADGTLALNTNISQRLSDQQLTYTLSYAKDYAAKSTIPLIACDVAYGNNVSIDFVCSVDGEIQSLKYTYLPHGNAEKFSWIDRVEETQRTVSLAQAEATTAVYAANSVNGYFSQSIPLVSHQIIQDMLRDIDDLHLYSAVEEERINKGGIILNFPISASFGGGGSLSLDGSFTDEFVYTNESGFILDGKTYITAHNMIDPSYADARRQNLTDLLKEPIDAIPEIVGQLFIDIGETIVDTAQGWYAEVKTLITGEQAVLATAMLALADEDEPDTTAASAVTLGDPYLITVYTDENKTDLVPEESLSANPLTITLPYSTHMLAEAGAAADADILIYRFDDARNLYVPLENCTQDHESMTVSAPITQSGEYILATDTASPLISGFTLSDGTAQPQISALISDLSGIRNFSFRIDDTVLVDDETFGDYYDPQTNIFRYSVETPLVGGAHTAYFEATDTLGNANAQPFAFDFTIDDEAPEITVVTVPTETVTDPNGFIVSAQAEDDTEVAQLSVRVTSDAGAVSTYEMTEIDGVWTAEIPDIAGISFAQIVVLALDTAGNTGESAAYTVNCAVAPIPQSAVVEFDREGSTVHYTISNPTSIAVGGRLFCAAYDAKNMQLDTQIQTIGLAADGSYADSFELSCAEDAIDSICFYYLDINNGFVPLTAKQ